MVAIVLIVGGFAGHSLVSRNSVGDAPTHVAHVGGTIDAIKHFISREYFGLLAFLGYPKNDASHMAVQTQNQTGTETSAAPQIFNGMAVILSDGSSDEETVRRVRDSFSDQVEVYPDQSGTAGVVKPVFKETKGDDFVYVLVPVKVQKEQKESGSPCVVSIGHSGRSFPEYPMDMMNVFRVHYQQA